MEFEPSSRRIIAAAIAVHRAVGPGLLESVYQRCLVVELRRTGASVRTEVAIPLEFRGIVIPKAYRVDLIVDESILVEVKSVQSIDPIHRAQVLTYLKLTKLRIGLLLNFNTPTMREGIVRLLR